MDLSAPPRSTGSQGYCYLIHLSPPLQHARHYLGWALDPFKRYNLHKRGRGSRLCAAQVKAGGKLELVSVVPGTRLWESHLKKHHGSVQWCPLCTPGAYLPTPK